MGSEKGKNVTEIQFAIIGEKDRHILDSEFAGTGDGCGANREGISRVRIKKGHGMNRGEQVGEGRRKN